MNDIIKKIVEKFNLNKKEAAVLSVLFDSSNGNGHDFGFTDEGRYPEGMSARSWAGYVGSLTKKGVVCIYNEDTPGMFYFPDEVKHLLIEKPRKALGCCDICSEDHEDLFRIQDAGDILRVCMSCLIDSGKQSLGRVKLKEAAGMASEIKAAMVQEMVDNPEDEGCEWLVVGTGCQQGGNMGKLNCAYCSHPVRDGDDRVATVGYMPGLEANPKCDPEKCPIDWCAIQHMTVDEKNAIEV